MSKKRSAKYVNKGYGGIYLDLYNLLRDILSTLEEIRDKK